MHCSSATCHDVDIATPLTPDEVTKRLKAAGLGAVPTGIEHGTVTAVSRRHALRSDDACAATSRRTGAARSSPSQPSGKKTRQRRDFTINALYATADGEVIDLVGGVADLEAGRVRFVGDATTRIREDYLRILRLFRFHAWYGKGEIDPDALRAAAAEKAGLAQLSGERVQKELLRLLEAENPAPILRAMAAAGILGELLPGALSIARLEKLAAIDADAFFKPDPILRLAALLPNDPVLAETIAKKLRLSNADAATARSTSPARRKRSSPIFRSGRCANCSIASTSHPSGIASS